MEIKRDQYLHRLCNRIDNGMVKIITGIRRCGKSYLMNFIFYNYLCANGIDKNQIIQFAFDSADDLRLIGENPVAIRKEKRKVDPNRFLHYMNNKISNSQKFFLLLDEVQELDCFEAVLNGYLRKPNLDIYVTGSNSKFLSSDILTEFEGRGDEIHVLPLSFSEFFSVYHGDKEEAFDDYITYGGLPPVALMKTEEQKIQYLKTQMKNTYLRDIVYHHNLYSDENIEELTDVLASCTASLVNPNKLTDTFHSIKGSKLSAPTIRDYISYLQDAFIINVAKRYDIKGKKYINSPYKIYFEDVGLRNAQLNFRQVEQTHLMENVLYNELRYRGYNVDVGVVEIRTKNDLGKETRKQLEIDFVANLGNKRYYLQSAYEIPDEKKWVQETKPFDHSMDSFKKIVIVNKTLKAKRDDHGYLMMGIKEFLLDQGSLDK